MAFQTLKISRYLCAVSIAKYLALPLFRYFTIDVSKEHISLPKFQEMPSPHKATLSEKFILEELSDILPNTSLFFDKRSPDAQAMSISCYFLSPDEKLRGIFLQKHNSKSALDSALSNVDVNLTPEIFANVLTKGNMNGAAILSFFSWALEHSNLPKNIESYTLVLKTLGRRKFFGFMEELLLRMRKDDVKPELETLQILFDSYARAHKVKKALDLFMRLEEIGADSNCMALNILLKCLCSRSHVKFASSLLNSMKGKFPYDNGTYNVVIGGWAKFGRVDKVEKYWMEMIKDSLKPDCQAFSYVIEALGRAGRINNAIDTFEMMKEHGCIPDSSIYNAMISNFIAAGDMQEALNYHKKMLRDCSPDSDTYSKLIIAFLKCRRVADALELMDEMLGCGITPSTGMVTSFIEPLCSFGPPHAAMMVYKNTKKAGCKMSLKTYKLLISRLSRLGKCGMLLKVWEDMQESGYAFDNEIYEHIISGLCNVGRVDTAVIIAEEALRKGCFLGRVVYSKLNNKLLASNKVETAYKLFLKVKDARNNANLRRFWRAHGWHF
ncbi:Putative pentatricopeptide repeat-containing protein [Apostasia shenzhenica]|uniref:Pentatricopeptide repeat-containing protein n=1 Tax=Apostasia shenzhenica TaxID=1088818 RepID=A0A2I0BEJ1_9ASPA|nr:Putative pentatricopeptide repeat-containing protein [Apostasia shenzhenica]